MELFGVIGILFVYMDCEGDYLDIDICQNVSDGTFKEGTYYWVKHTSIKLIFLKIVKMSNCYTCELF